VFLTLNYFDFKFEILIFLSTFSMFLSILLKEPHGLILSYAKLQLYGTINMQVCADTFTPFSLRAIFVLIHVV
jgi:hypothetical protein